MTSCTEVVSLRWRKAKASGHYIQYIVVIVRPSIQVVSRSGKHMDARVSATLLLVGDRLPRPRSTISLSTGRANNLRPSDRAVTEAYLA